MPYWKLCKTHEHAFTKDSELRRNITLVTDYGRVDIDVVSLYLTAI